MTGTTALIEIADQLRAQIWTAFVAWAFMPVLCKALRHGEIVLKIHDGQLREVNVHFGTRGESAGVQ